MGSKESTVEPALDRIEQVLTALTLMVNNPSGRIQHPGNASQAIKQSPSLSENKRRLDTAIAWVRVHQARDKAIGADLFSDPAWSMLLDLYINRSAQRAVSMSSLSIAANVPLTTGVRWVAILEKAGLIVRTPDRFDRRRTLLVMTDQAVTKMEDALDCAIETNRLLGVEHVGMTN